jgi:hypothetical protein
MRLGGTGDCNDHARWAHRTKKARQDAALFKTDPGSTHIRVLHGTITSLKMDPVSTHIHVLHGTITSLKMDPVSTHIHVLHGMMAF